MQLNLLHLDGALTAQSDFISAAIDARHLHVETDGAAVRLWGKQPALDALAAKLPVLFDVDGPFLTFMGSGDFHHISALLLAQVAQRYPQPITLVHFDNHPDWVKYNGGLHCGSWVNGARAIPNVQRALTLGLCSDDIYNKSGHANLDLTASGFLEIFPYAEIINLDAPPPLAGGGRGRGAIKFQIPPHPASTKLAAQAKSSQPWTHRVQPAGGEGKQFQKFIEMFLTRIPTQQVYITLDKDVLVRDDAVTNWDQGQMRLDDVIHIIQAIGARHKIIGADVIGDYSPVRFSGSPLQKILKYGEVFLDHPRARPDPAQAANINARANICLLRAFSMLMQ